jgi:hypothetical protein
LFLEKLKELVMSIVRSVKQRRVFQ